MKHLHPSLYDFKQDYAGGGTVADTANLHPSLYDFKPESDTEEKNK